jgi:hypothetical protein
MGVLSHIFKISSYVGRMANFIKLIVLVVAEITKINLLITQQECCNTELNTKQTNCELHLPTALSHRQGPLLLLDTNLGRPDNPKNFHVSRFIFWVVTPRGLVGRYQRFGGRQCLHLQGWWRQYVPSKRWYIPSNPHGVTTQKTNIDIFTSVRPSNLKNCYVIKNKGRIESLRMIWQHCRPSSLSVHRPAAVPYHSLTTYSLRPTTSTLKIYFRFANRHFYVFFPMLR